MSGPLPQFTFAQTRAPGDDSVFWYGDPRYEGQPGPWNTMRLDGKIFPGADDYRDARVCPVKIRARCSYRVDHAKIKGQDGHRLVIEGYQPQEIEIEVTIWTEKQWRAYLAILNTINPKLQPDATASGDARSAKSITVKSGAFAGATASASTTAHTGRVPHTIEHPDLAALQIYSIYITEVPTTEDGPVWGSRIVRLKAIEVFEGKSKANVTKVVKSSDSEANVPPVIDEAKLDTSPGPDV